MNDIYLVKRESNRGCWVLGAAALMILALAWFVFFRGPSDRVAENPEPAPSPFNDTPAYTSDIPAVPPPVVEQGEPTPMEVRRPGGTRPNPAAIAKSGQPGPFERARNGNVLGGNRVGQANPGNQRANPDSATALGRAKESSNTGDWPTARKYGFMALEKATSAGGVRNAEVFLSDLHSKMAFSKVDMPEKKTYKIKYGDSLSKIAGKYGTTSSLIKRVNGLKSDSIRLGDSLKVIDGSWKVHVDVSDRAMRLLLNDTFFKRYDVGVGRPGSDTPPGNYYITTKQKNPPWYKSEGVKIPFGDPRNELGTRWMGWDLKSFGIHGTNDPSSIGGNTSSGCVRMHNQDVEELFDILPRKAEIVVSP